MAGDGFEPSEKGTPQGGNLSPLLSNVMLNELDRELEARGLRFTRYADDCIIDGKYVPISGRRKVSVQSPLLLDWADFAPC